MKIPEYLRLAREAAAKQDKPSSLFLAWKAGAFLQAMDPETATILGQDPHYQAYMKEWRERNPELVREIYENEMRARRRFNPDYFPNEDEAAVIAKVTEMATERLRKGREAYGPMDLGKPRQLEQDIEEEVADALVYIAMKQLAR